MPTFATDHAWSGEVDTERKSLLDNHSMHSHTPYTRENGSVTAPLFASKQVASFHDPFQPWSSQGGVCEGHKPITQTHITKTFRNKFSTIRKSIPSSTIARLCVQDLRPCSHTVRRMDFRAHRRRPYPYGAWPYAENRSKISGEIESRANLADPSTCVRSDPSLTPIGACRADTHDDIGVGPISRRHTAAYDSVKATAAHQQELLSPSTSTPRRRPHSQSMFTLLLEELEEKFPIVKTLRHFHIRVRPAFPPRGLFGILRSAHTPSGLLSSFAVP